MWWVFCFFVHKKNLRGQKFFRRLGYYEIRIYDYRVERMVEDRDMSKQAVIRIYEEYRGRLWLAAYEIVKDDIYAQDIVHDIFEKLWEDGLIQGTEKQQYAYVRKAVKNLAKDVVGVLELEKQGLIKLAHCAEEKDSVESVILTRERIREIHQAVLSFSQKERQLFCYRVWDGLSYDEISAMWNISKPNMYVLMYRIRQKLRKLCMMMFLWGRFFC